MLPPKPKSAPPRFKAKRTNVTKEIEEWVLSDTEFARETSRHSGQLAENITEERMLRAKLFDLGKERFKCLSKHSYEKQTFIEKQKRKAAALRKNRVPVQFVDRSKSSSGYSTAQSILSKSERGIDIKIDPLPGPVRETLYPIRPKTVQFEQNLHKSGYLATGLDDSRPYTVPGAGNGFDGFPRPGQDRVASTPLGVCNQWSRPSTGGLSRTPSSISMASESTKSWRDKRLLRFGHRFPGVTHDPRYSKLERALSANYISRTKVDVKTIIEKVESLRKPFRAEESAGPTLEQKIKIFMAERGITFT